jgi:hypothetical protein
MPPLIRRSQSAVPRHAGEDGGHLGLGPTRRLDMLHPVIVRGRSPQRSVTGPAAADTRMRIRCHPGRCPAPSPGRPPRPSSCWPPRCTGRSRSWPFPNGLFPGLARGGEDTRQRTRPGQAPVNGLLPVRIAADRSVNLIPFAAIPMRCVPACLSTSRCAGTASPRSSAGRPRSCSPPPRPTSPARCAMIPVDGGAISSI